MRAGREPVERERGGERGGDTRGAVGVAPVEQVSDQLERVAYQPHDVLRRRERLVAAGKHAAEHVHDEPEVNAQLLLLRAAARAVALAAAAARARRARTGGDRVDAARAAAGRAARDGGRRVGEPRARARRGGGRRRERMAARGARKPVLRDEASGELLFRDAKRHRK